MARDKPDGWGVLHTDGKDHGYMFGPLPSKEVADLIQSQVECECITHVVQVYFPEGLTMLMRVDGLLPPDVPVSDRIH